MREVEDYMGYREIPEVLRQKIRDYFERRFRGKVFNEDHILNSLSEPLREVSREIQFENAHANDLDLAIGNLQSRTRTETRSEFSSSARDPTQLSSGTSVSAAVLIRFGRSVPVGFGQSAEVRIFPTLRSHHQAWNCGNENVFPSERSSAHSLG